MRILIIMLMLLVNLSVPSIDLNAQSAKQFAKQIQESAETAVGRKTGCDFSTEKSVTLDPDTMENAALKKVEPIYPQRARQQGIQGLVMVRVVVNSRGDVERVCALSGDDLLRPPVYDGANRSSEAFGLKWKRRSGEVVSKGADSLRTRGLSLLDQRRHTRALAADGERR